jgi:hypothetical protein
MLMTIAVLFVFAILVEAVVDIILGDVNCPKWIKKALAMAIGIAVCVVWQVGIISLLGITSVIRIAATFDYVITGIAISRGSNYISDLLTSLAAYRAGKNATVTQTTTPVVPGTSTTTETTTTTPTEELKM